jgi:hypothetical protein
MWRINKFWIWLALLIGSIHYNPDWTLLVWVGGTLYLTLWSVFSKDFKQLKLQEGTWIKSITQANGLTQVVITDGKDESIQQYNSNRVEVSGNIIYIY